MKNPRIHPFNTTSICFSNGLWLWLLLLATTSFSQNQEFKCGVFNNGSDPNGRYDYYDRFGNGYMADDLSLLGLNIQTSPCEQIEDFTLIYENTNGMFPFTFEERQTICNVFIYLSTVIDAPSGEKAIVRLAKNPDLGTGTGAVGTAFFSPQCGLGHSAVEQQLFTGGVNAPQHAFIEVNAGINNFYIGPEAGIDADEIDFYTVILHEALHTLGFGSQITPSGDPQQGFYTLWDLNLRNPAGEFMVAPLPGGNGPCCATYKFNADDFPDMPDIIWNQDCGPSNVQFDVTQLPPVNGEYSGQNPDEFVQVLSHLDRICGTEHYVMNAGIPDGPDGIQRNLTPTETSILCKLGYDTDNCDPDCIAIAADDGNFFVGLGGNITIDVNTLQSNDFPADAVFALKLDCGSHGGLGIAPSPIPNPTQIDISGLAIGAYTFCYTITSCDGKRCDVGTVHVVVTNPAIGEACQNLEPCQINPYWDLELFGSPDEMYPLLTLGQGNGMGDGVPNTGFSFHQDIPAFGYDNTPDLLQNPITLLHGRVCGGVQDIPNINSFGSQSLGMIVRRVDGTNLPEGACFPLCEPIFPGMSGTVTFYAMTPEACVGTSEIRVEFSEGAPVDHEVVYDNPGISSPSVFVPITSHQNSNPVFDLYTAPFNNETDICWNFLYLSSFTNTDNFPPPLPGYGYIVLDNVRVELNNNLANVLDVATSVDPVGPCLGNVVTFEIEICNNLDCPPNTYSSPEFFITGALPPGLSHVPNNDFPSLTHLVLADEIPYGECIQLELTAQVGSDISLIGQPLNITLTLGTPDVCYTEFTMGAGGVTPIDCEGFSCRCTGTGQLNINAGSDGQFYDPTLDGTPLSALEAAFNYDSNNDGYIDKSEHNGCIAILGRLIIDQNLGITECQNVKMQPCSEIVVGTNTIHSSLDLSGSSLYGCDIMWHGITVMPYAELKYKNASFSDAQFAVTAIGSGPNWTIPPTRFYSRGGIFVRNHIGVYIPTSWLENLWHAPFINNTFIGSEQGKTLLPPCDANLPNYSAQMGYAGLVTLGTSFEVGNPGQGGYVNAFRDIRNGVIGMNSPWMNVYSARFDNLPGYMGINGSPSFNASSGVGVLIQGGYSSVNYSRFEGVGHGVYAVRSWNVTVEKNQMHDVYTGIQTARPVNFGFKDNIPILFRDFGIHAVNPTAIYPFGGFTIDGNYLNTLVADNDGVVEAGIYIFDSHNLGDLEDSRITDNTVRIRNTTDGISIASVDHWLLDDNHIYFQNHLGNLPHTTNGIGLVNSSSNELYGNTVTDNSTNALKSDFGFHTSTSQANIFCCNSTALTDWGLFFDGTCDNTLLRYQNTDGHIFNALECTPGTVISDQPYLLDFPNDNHSNKFHMGSVATHGGNLDQIQNSEFFVKTGVPLDHPETIFLPNIPGGYDPLNPKWFLVSGNDNNDCNTAGGCPPPPPPLGGEPPIRDKSLSGTDDYFASGGFLGSPYGDALQWEGGLRLYKRLRQYPELLGQSAPVDAFYANAGTSAIGAYAAVDGAIARIRILPEEWTSAMQSAQTDIQNATDAAGIQLAALASVGTWEDSMTIYRAAEQTRLSALPAYQSLMQYVQLADSLRSTRAQAAWALNQALPAADILQSNRKTVNKVYLETLGQGIMSLTTTQFAAIEPIARQCPLEGGGAVYTARGLYQLYTEEQFDDRSLCGFGNQEREVQPADANPYETLKVQPNPAFGDMLVTLPASFAGDEVWVEISDIDGRVAFSKRVPEDADTLLIDVSNLPVGIYILSAIGNSKTLAPVKLVVQH